MPSIVGSRKHYGSKFSGTRAVPTGWATALSKEWLETNGLGGFSSSTLIGCNTRRYHGILVAATHPPHGRMMLVNGFEEWVVLNDARYFLSRHQYPGVVHPRGHENLI